jgi:hypothetical protein
MRNTILHALSVAAERFRDNAKAIRLENMGADGGRIADQFEIQAREALAAHALLSEGFLCAFSTDNAAFQGVAAPATADVLFNIAQRVRQGAETSGAIWDLNGNTLGAWSLDHTDDAPDD